MFLLLHKLSEHWSVRNKPLDTVGVWENVGCSKSKAYAHLLRYKYQ